MNNNVQYIGHQWSQCVLLRAKREDNRYFMIVCWHMAWKNWPRWMASMAKCFALPPYTRIQWSSWLEPSGRAVVYGASIGILVMRQRLQRQHQLCDCDVSGLLIENVLQPWNLFVPWHTKRKEGSNINYGPCRCDGNGTLFSLVNVKNETLV